MVHHVAAMARQANRVGVDTVCLSDGTVLVGQQQCFQMNDLVPKCSRLTLKVLVVIRQIFHLSLKISQPLLLALSAFECGLTVTLQKVLSLLLLIHLVIDRTRLGLLPVAIITTIGRVLGGLLRVVAVVLRGHSAAASALIKSRIDAVPWGVRTNSGYTLAVVLVRAGMCIGVGLGWMRMVLWVMRMACMWWVRRLVVGSAAIGICAFSFDPGSSRSLSLLAEKVQVTILVDMAVVISHVLLWRLWWHVPVMRLLMLLLVRRGMRKMLGWSRSWSAWRAGWM